MACNGLFGTGEPYDICPPNPNKYFTLKKAELVVPNKPAWKVFYDLQVIYQVSRDLPHDSVRAAQALYAANKIVNTIRVEDEASLYDAAEIAKEFFGSKNGTSQHSLTAVGHCHIGLFISISHNVPLRGIPADTPLLSQTPPGSGPTLRRAVRLRVAGLHSSV